MKPSDILLYYNIPCTRLRFPCVAEMLTSQKIRTRRFSTRFEDTQKNHNINILLLFNPYYYYDYYYYIVYEGRCFNKLRIRVLSVVVLQVNRTRAIYVKQQLVGKYAISTVHVICTRRVRNCMVCTF